MLQVLLKYHWRKCVNITPLRWFNISPDVCFYVRAAVAKSSKIVFI